MNNKTIRNLSYFILFISLGIISWLILHDVNWIFGDDDLFLRTTMIGKPSHAWTGKGRFWPLGLCDYTVLLGIPFGNTITAHFLYNIIIMIISVMTLFHFMNKSNGKNYSISLFYTLILFSISSFVQIHMSCIYPERFMFFMQVLFMYFWWKARQNQSVSYYAVSWLCATYVIFCKEPVFAAIAVLALTNLILGIRTLTKKDKNFYISLLASSLIYFVIYVYRYFFRDNHTNGFYGGGKLIFMFGVDTLNIIKTFFCNEPILFLIFLTGLIRAYFVLIKKDRRTLELDGLLFASCAYSTAYIILVMTYSYYVFPSVIFALPALSYWTAYFLKKSKNVTIILLLSSICLAISSIKSSTNWILNTYNLRRNDMPLATLCVKAYHEGKNIHFFMNSRPMSMFRVGAVHGNVWEFSVMNHFFNFVLGNQYKSIDRNIIIPIQNLEDVSDNSVVLCPVEADSKYKDYLRNRGFRLLGKAFNLEFYEH